MRTQRSRAGTPWQIRGWRGLGHLVLSVAAIAAIAVVVPVPRSPATTAQRTITAGEEVSAAGTQRVALPPRIMLVGDSITHGPAGAYTWRYFLYQDLATAYGPGDYFVGPSQAPNDGTVDDYAVATGWDKDHAARSGRMLDCYLDGWIGDEPCNDPGRAVADLETYDPDLVVVLLGTNDVLLAWGKSTPAEYLANVETLIALGRANNPSVSFLFLGVIPVDPALIPEAAGEAAEMNAGLGDLAERLDSPTSRVAYAPAGEGFDPVLHTTDGVHPNSLGDEVIAANALAGLRAEFGIGGQSESPSVEPV